MPRRLSCSYNSLSIPALYHFVQINLLKSIRDDSIFHLMVWNYGNLHSVECLVKEQSRVIEKLIERKPVRLPLREGKMVSSRPLLQLGRMSVI